MNIYKHKENKKLYLIEHLIYDIHFADAGESKGVYASPYNHKGDEIIYKTKDFDEMREFVEENFIIVSEI